MPGRHQSHVYSQDEIERLKSVPLPAKIKCGLCNKNLPQVKFSTKQLTDARYQVQKSTKMHRPINCQACVGTPVVEIECTMCGKTKGLSSFAKSQRRKADTAKCFKCIEVQLASEACEENKYKEPNKAFITPDTSNGQFPEYFSAATTDTSSTHDGDDGWNTVNDSNRRRDHRSQRIGLEDGGIALSVGFQNALSISGSADQSLIGTEYAYPAVGNGDGDGDGWGEARTKSWHTKSTGVSSASSGFDPNAYGRRSTTSVAGSSRSFASSVVERSDTSEVRSNGWAKIKAAPRAPAIDAWQSDDDEDEAKDDDSDDDSDDDDDTVI